MHRLVAKAFIPNSNNLPQVNHIDGVKTNNVITNLEWVSSSANVKHAWDTGLIDRNKVSGENHKNSKLTALDVKDIRALFKAMSVKRIAEVFGVSSSTISDIKNNKTWKL